MRHLRDWVTQAYGPARAGSGTSTPAPPAEWVQYGRPEPGEAVPQGMSPAQLAEGFVSIRREEYEALRRVAIAARRTTTDASGRLAEALRELTRVLSG